MGIRCVFFCYVPYHKLLYSTLYIEAADNNNVDTGILTLVLNYFRAAASSARILLFFFNFFCRLYVYTYIMLQYDIESQFTIGCHTITGSR